MVTSFDVQIGFGIVPISDKPFALCLELPATHDLVRVEKLTCFSRAWWSVERRFEPFVRFVAHHMTCSHLDVDPSVNVTLVITVFRNMLTGHTEVGKGLFTSWADVGQADA